MDDELRGAIQRLKRTTDFERVLSYTAGRRDIFLSSLTNTNPNDVGLVASAQGSIRAFNEILALIEDADNG